MNHAVWNPRLLLMGQGISQLGDRFHQIALLWLSYDLTGSEVMLGLVAIFTALPDLLFGIVGGTLTDRWDRKMLMILSDLLRCGIVLVIPSLYASGWLTVAWLCVLAFLLGTLTQLFEPSKQASIPLLVGKERLVSFNSVLSVTEQVVRIAGAALAGLLIAWLGISLLFVINAVSFLLSALFIGAMQIPKINRVTATQPFVERMKAGLQRVLQHRLLRNLLLIDAGMNLFFTGTAILLPPLLAENVYRTGSSGYGYLLSAYSIGTVLGALVIRKIHKRYGKGKLFAWGLVCLGTSYLIIGWIPHFCRRLIGLFLTGFFVNMVNISLVSMFQSSVEVEYLGSAFGVVRMVSSGLIPFSYLLVSTLSTRVPLLVLFWVSGTLFVLGGIYALKQRVIRQAV